MDMDAFEYVIDNLEVVDIKPTDCFMIKIVNDEISLESARELFRTIEEKYPHNTVFMIPDGAMLEIYGIEESKKWLRTVLNALEDVEDSNEGNN